MPNDSQAMLSLILGIGSVALCCWILGPVAFLIGNASLNRIRTSNGSLGGANMAQAGRILGIVGTVLLALGVLWVIVTLAATINSR